MGKRSKPKIYDRLPLSRPSSCLLDMPQAEHEYGSVLLAENERLCARIRELEAEIARLKSPKAILTAAEKLLRDRHVSIVQLWNPEIHVHGKATVEVCEDVIENGRLAEEREHEAESLVAAYARLKGGDDAT